MSDLNNNGFILKPEMYSQKEWYDMYIKVVQEYQEKDKEIDRLNNIINQLEKYCEEQMYISKDLRENQYCLGRYDSSQDTLDRLKELKEENK